MEDGFNGLKTIKLSFHSRGRGGKWSRKRLTVQNADLGFSKKEKKGKKEIAGER